VGSVESVLHGLSHGVNAVLHRAGGHEQPEGSTVVAQPGDVIDTDEPYSSALLEEDAKASPAKATAKKAPAKKAAAKAAAPKSDPEPAPVEAAGATDPVVDGVSIPAPTEGQE
jgi:hypothetical protein